MLVFHNFFQKASSVLDSKIRLTFHQLNQISWNWDLEVLDDAEHDETIK